MSRKKKWPLLPWLSVPGAIVKPSQQEPYIQVGKSLLLDKGFQELSAGAKVLYLCMAMESGGRREFVFPAQTMKKYGIPRQSALKWIKELEAAGFIVCTYKGHVQKKPSEYEFSRDRPPKIR